jgi:molecular chaperone GrpE
MLLFVRGAEMGEAVEIPVRVHRHQVRDVDDVAFSMAVDEEHPIADEAPVVDSEKLVDENQHLADQNQRLADENEQLKQALRELKKDFQRARDHAHEQQQVARQTGEELAARAVLPVVEALLRAQEQYRKKHPGLVGGIQLLQAKVEAALASAGFTPLGEVGEPFDPRRHEAVTAVGAGDIETVAQVVVPGLARGEQVVVPARVVVGRTTA